MTRKSRGPPRKGLWAYAYDQVGIHFAGDPRKINPDDMHDHVQRSREWDLREIKP